MASMPEAKPEILRFFAFEHLPERLRAVSVPFFSLAHFVAQLPASDERDASLRKLLEAKDCAVRALL